MRCLPKGPSLFVCLLYDSKDRPEGRTCVCHFTVPAVPLLSFAVRTADGTCTLFPPASNGEGTFALLSMFYLLEVNQGCPHPRLQLVAPKTSSLCLLWPVPLLPRLLTLCSSFPILQNGTAVSFLVAQSTASTSHNALPCPSLVGEVPAEVGPCVLNS